jgi:hypothetical protein
MARMNPYLAAHDLDSGVNNPAAAPVAEHDHRIQIELDDLRDGLGEWETRRIRSEGAARSTLGRPRYASRRANLHGYNELAPQRAGPSAPAVDDAERLERTSRQ